MIFKIIVFRIVYFILFYYVFSFSVAMAYDFSIARLINNPLVKYKHNTNYFGKFNEKKRHWHWGDDFVVPAGTKVYSIANGIVKFADNLPCENGRKNYGGLYIIEYRFEDGEVVCGLYGHLDFSTFTKKVGDIVRMGEFIGRIGDKSSNGGHDSPHLHFAIKKGNYKENKIEFGKWSFAGHTRVYESIYTWYNPTAYIKKRKSIKRGGSLVVSKRSLKKRTKKEG